MSTKKKRLVALCAGSICAMALGTGVAMASNAGDDSWLNGTTNQANMNWSATSTSFKFTAGAFTVTCTSDAASGNTGSNPDAGLIAMNQPTYSSCGSATVTTATTGWQIAFWSDAQPTACGTGVTSDENKTTKTDNECVQIRIPQRGAQISLLGCIVTISPAGTSDVYGTVTENSPAGADSIKFTNQSVPFTTNGAFGCPANGNGTLNGTYTLGAVNGKYLDDDSGSDDTSGPDGDS